VKGESVDLTPAPAPQAKVVDLMEALKASLARSGALPAAAPAPAPAASAADAERKPPRQSPKSDEVAAEGDVSASPKKKKAKG
jgi:ribosomal protein L12E/L44/L45/RPP1/RPP2